MSKTIRVFIVDDHPMLRKGLIQVISQDPELDVVGEAGSAEDALARIKDTGTAVAVLDIDLPGMDGLTLADKLLDQIPGMRVVLLTMHDSEEMLTAAVDLGINAYILKDEVDAGIICGIKSAAKGETYVTPSLAKYLMRRSRRGSTLRRESGNIDSLTPMERKVLRLVAQQLTSADIAERLFISVRTVETHRSNICTKLEITGNNALLRFTMEHATAIRDLTD